jgi:hypothetical protein
MVEQTDPMQHPLEAELEKLQATIDALEACPLLWWVDKLS